MPEQMHTRFRRRAATLLPIAGHATTDDILPVFPAALGDRHDMIEGQFAHGELVATVLTSMLVARVNVGAREWDVIEPALDLDVSEEPDNRGQLEAERHGSHFPVVHRDDLNLALAPQRDRLLPVDNLERL